MITIKCDTGTTLKLSQLTEFQGDLKKRTKKDVAQLSESIQADGLIMPFAIWSNGSSNNLLDGHGRLLALTDLALSDVSIAEQDFPVIYISAENEDEAKKALLQISSQYGKITREGAAKFCATIPTYKAQAINKFTKSVVRRNKPEKQQLEQIIRLRVPVEKVAQVKELLKQVSYIEVLE